jgi:hypothetical protein
VTRFRDTTDANDLWTPLTPPNPAAVVRKCRRHDNQTWIEETDEWECQRCGHRTPVDRIRRGRNNRSRGNREELTVARAIGGRKVGPLGHPWDVEMPGYARLQVKKLATAPSLRTIAAELARIGSGAEMPGFVWVEPGRGGERLIVFRLADFAERHGVPEDLP